MSRCTTCCSADLVACPVKSGFTSTRSPSKQKRKLLTRLLLCSTEAGKGGLGALCDDVVLVEGVPDSAAAGWVCCGMPACLFKGTAAVEGAAVRLLDVCAAVGF